jgi:hypothetical protein
MPEMQLLAEGDQVTQMAEAGQRGYFIIPL